MIPQTARELPTQPRAENPEDAGRSERTHAPANKSILKNPQIIISSFE